MRTNKGMWSSAYRGTSGISLDLSFFCQHCKVGAALDSAFRIPGALSMSHKNNPLWTFQCRQRLRRQILAIVQVGKLVSALPGEVLLCRLFCGVRPGTRPLSSSYPCNSTSLVCCCDRYRGTTDLSNDRPKLANARRCS